MELKRRTIARIILWRVIATLLTLAVAYYLTGNLAFAGEMTFVYTIISLVVHYLYERLWIFLPYGKIDGQTDSEDDIVDL